MKDTRPWMDDYARESVASPLQDGSWRIENVRDFSYGPHTVTKQAWLQESVAPNTVTAQCTNKLLELFNHAEPGTLPWHLFWYFPGLSPRYLARHGLLDLASKEII